MVWNQAPSVDCGLGFAGQIAQAFQETGAVSVIREDAAALDATSDDVVKDAWGIQSWTTRHTEVD